MGARLAHHVESGPVVNPERALRSALTGDGIRGYVDMPADMLRELPFVHIEILPGQVILPGVVESYGVTWQAFATSKSAAIDLANAAMRSWWGAWQKTTPLDTAHINQLGVDSSPTELKTGMAGVFCAQGAATVELVP